MFAFILIVLIGIVVGYYIDTIISYNETREYWDE